MICRVCWTALRNRKTLQLLSHPLPLPRASSSSRHSSSSSSPHPQLLDSRLLKFHLAVQSGSPDQIKSSYKQLRSQYSSQQHLEFDEAFFTKAMHIMSKSNVKEEINMVFVMFSDLVSLFEMKPKKEHHLAVLQATLSRGWNAQARLRLQDQPAESEDYVLVMSAFYKDGQEKVVIEIFLEGIQAGIDPNAEMYRILLMCKETLKEPKLRQALSDAMHVYLSRKSARSAFSRSFWDGLLSPDSNQGEMIISNTAEVRPLQSNVPFDFTSNTLRSSDYRLRPPTIPTSPVTPPSLSGTPSTHYTSPLSPPKGSAPHNPTVVTLIEQDGVEAKLQQLNRTLVSQGFEAALSLLEKQKVGKIRSSERLISTLSNAASKSSDLLQITRRLGVTLKTDVWVRLITKTVKSKGIPAALASYLEAKELGVSPLNLLAEPLLSEFSENRLRSANDDRLQEALQIYRLALESKEGLSNFDPSLMQRTWRSIYESLLRVLANSADPKSTFPVALNLLEDMRMYEISFDISTATTLAILLMRSSPSHDAAYEVYTVFQAQYFDALDSRNCDAILGAFSQLSFPHQRFTPPSLFFMMLNSMQRSAFQLSKRAYTTILSHIARTAAHSDDNAVALDTIRQIHKRLLLDSSLSPDTVLLNSLMNAYNRTGSALEAIRVWESLYMQGKHDNASLSIVLDTLSHSGAPQQAAGVMAKLHKSGFQFDRNNWQSWLELLCRAEKFEEALRLLSYDMQKTEPPVIPDHEHIGTLLKYSWNSGKRREILSRVRRNWPSVWSSLPEEMKA